MPDSLRQTLDAIKRLVETISKHYESQNGPKNTPLEIHGQVETRLPEEISEYYKTQNTDRPVEKRKDNVRFLLEIAGTILGVLVFLATIITLVVFHGQLVEMRLQTGLIEHDAIVARRLGRQQLRVLGEQAQSAQDSVAAIQRQMRQDQRAWIKLSDSPTGLISEGAVITTNVTVLNVGKTPARNLRTEFVITLVQNHKPLVFPYSRVARVFTLTGILWPNIPQQFLVRSQRIVKGKAETWQITAAEWDALRKGTSYFIIYGRTRYLDIFGVSHEIRYCSWGQAMPGEYTASQCTAYNAADNN